MQFVRRTPLRRALAASLVAALACARALAAQCPDGTPPPCRGAIAAVTPRRNAPALDEHAWIVVPFANVMKVQDLDWLRDASVNLLSLDIGRWTDVTVVPDKRVDDLVRQARTPQPLTLSDGLALARRAGAGKLVMGDFYRIGRGARLVANVFDVRTGARLRSVERQAADQDSLLGAFGPLARGVLAVPPPPDARSGDFGTNRIDAYQEYLLGVQALNRFRLADARAHLMRALAIDSTFALAHLQLSLTLAWGEANTDNPEQRVHAAAAQRFGASLPPRERALIAGNFAMATGDYTRACADFAPLVAKDSSDVQALYMLGECSFHDQSVAPGASDTVPGRFRGDWNASLRAFRRVLELDPAFHPAFEHILNILSAPSRGSCVPRPGAGCDFWNAAVLRSGDTLEIEPVRDSTNRPGWYAQVNRAAKEKPLLANLAEARTIAQSWFDADTTEDRARFQLASVMLRQGDVANAIAVSRFLHPPATAGMFPVLRFEIEVAAKSGRGADARAWYDSLVKAIPDAPSIMVTRGGFELMFGRFGRVVPGMAAAAAAQGPAAVAYRSELPRLVLGVPSRTIVAAEAAYDSTLRATGCADDCRRERMFVTLVYGVRLPRGGAPRFLTESSDDDRLRLFDAVTRRDTARIRAVAWEHDSLAHRNVEMGWPDNQWTVIAADGYLAIPDSVAALRTARFYVDTVMPRTPIVALVPGTAISASAFWPRMMLLRADLAAAKGYKAEARTWYLRVLDLWASADAELAPEVARIRASLAALGP